MAVEGKSTSAPPVLVVEVPETGMDGSNEIKKMTRIVKLYEYTCTFCFKRFYSAQAMGGHQNAHRHERSKEKKHFIRDPIGYRKRGSPMNQSHDHPKKKLVPLMPKPVSFKEVGQISSPPPPPLRQPVVISSAGKTNCFYHHPYYGTPLILVNDKPTTFAPNSQLNFLPAKEHCLEDKVGFHADQGAAVACKQVEQVNHLDLTLKL